MKKYNKLLNSKGITLIEVIIALAILSIITTSFLSLFTSGYKTVFSAGQKTTAVFKTQEVMERQIAGLTIEDGDTDYITIDKASDTLSINFFNESDEEESIEVEVNGSTIKVEYNDEKHYVNFSSFIPEDRGE